MKSQTLRKLDADGIRERLEETDLTSTLFPELKTFENNLKEFVDHGHGSSGRVPLPRIHRVLEYRLTTRPNLESSAILRAT